MATERSGSLYLLISQSALFYQQLPFMLILKVCVDYIGSGKVKKNKMLSLVIFHIIHVSQ